MFYENLVILAVMTFSQLVLQATKKTSIRIFELEQSIRHITANARSVRVYQVRHEQSVTLNHLEKSCSARTTRSVDIVLIRGNSIS